MKKEKMEKGTAYIKCPNYECKLWDDDKISCERDCPQKNSLEKLMRCWKCGDIIRLPLDYNSMCRIDHTCIDKSTPLLLLNGTIVVTRENII